MNSILSYLNSFILLTLLISCSLSAQSITWTEGDEMPLARRNFRNAVAGNKIYAIGGYCNETDDRYESLNYEYDPALDKWEIKTPAPTGRSNLAVNSFNGKIYVIGGDPVSDAAEVYDPSSDTWSELAPIPTPRQHISGAVINGKIYVVGGLEANPVTFADTTKKWYEKILVSNKNEAYDIAANTWQVLSPMPTKRHGAAVAAVNNKLYVFCGAGSDSSLWTLQNSVEVYDPAADSWEQLQPIPLAKLDPGIAVIEDNIFFFGGQDGQSEPRGDLKSVFIYNTTTDEWKRINNLPYDLMFAGVAVWNDKIVITGGSDHEFKEYKKTIMGTINWNVE